jgi:thiol-disulfide isomerase/thioredoxin
MLVEKVSSYKEFLNYLEKYKHVIVNISASWCKPCVAIKPQIEKFVSIINEPDFIYLKIDMSLYEEDFRFQSLFNVSKIPYFSLIKDGKVNDEFVSGDFLHVSKKIFDFTKQEQFNKNVDF